MVVEDFSFGRIRIDGKEYAHDVIVDRGEIRKRSKKKSKPLREQFGHTPLTVYEDIPWKCDRLLIGTGAEGALPITKDVIREAKRRGVELLQMPTAQAIAELNAGAKDTNAVLHVTC
jgi:hypothetical protein